MEQTRNKSNDYFETSSQCNTGRMCVILPIITRENTPLDRFNVSPVRGEKPKNWPVSKNNTGRGACGRSCR